MFETGVPPVIDNRGASMPIKIFRPMPNEAKE
jgi:hypothetical protein